MRIGAVALPIDGAPPAPPRQDTNRSAPARAITEGPRNRTMLQAHTLIAPRLVIEFDAAADRFVHTIVDRGANEILRRFPDEAQLAFSRGVNTYIAALRAR